MKTHVFIVNDQTFPYHLRYLFAGTGAKNKNNNFALLSDIKRVRAGDFVIFYIEGTTKVKGGFYGIFTISNNIPLVFHTPGKGGYRPAGLGKKLIYRTLIEPYEVYSEGVPEWEVLDKLPTCATEIQWSLIYRKLKGKRGCTPLLPWEAERLMDMIRNKNNGKIIANNQSTCGFDWDVSNRKIITTKNRKKYSFPMTYNYNVLDEICKRLQKKKAYEILLQLYFMENIGINPNLQSIVGQNLIWFGNEVACGVGMQKIDILTICDNNNRKEYRIIELKDEPIQPEVVNQIEYYVNWASQNSGRHLVGAFNWNIQPVIVAPHQNQNSSNWQNVAKALKDYNNKGISLPVLYFEFNVDCNNNTKTITFQQITY